MDQLKVIAEGRGKDIRIGIENPLHKGGPYYILIKCLLLSNEMLIKIFALFIKRAIGTAGGIGYEQVR